MSLNHFVDAAVDKAAATAKVKVKSMFGGKGGDAKKPSKSGGMGGLFPSAGDSGGKEKKGGLIGGLFAAPQDEKNPGAAEVAGGVAGGNAGGNTGGNAGGGTEDLDFSSAVDELADF